MARTFQLTVDVDENLLTTGTLGLRRRVTNFLERSSLTAGVSVLFAGTEAMALEALAVDVTVEGLRFPKSVLRELTKPGDRIVLRTEPAGDRSTFEVLDGSYVFVQHVLNRATSPLFDRLLPIVPVMPSHGDVHVREAWARARNDVLEAFAEDYLRGPLATRPLARWLEQHGVQLAVGRSALEPESQVMVDQLASMRSVYLQGQHVARLLAAAQALFSDAAIGGIRDRFSLALSMLDGFAPSHA